MNSKSRTDLSRRPANPGRFRPRLESLEDRATPATLYIDDTFRITTNTGAIGLTPGDTVTWNPGQFGQVAGLTFGTDAFRTVRDAITAASSGDVIQVAPGTFFETAQSVIPDNFDITVIGAGSNRTTIRAGFNTDANGDGRGWFLVSSGATFNLEDVTINGYGRQIADAIRYKEGSLGGTINRVAFRYINHAPGSYDGLGVSIKSGNVDVLNSTFNVIGRIGVQYLNAGTTGLYAGNTYVGRGYGSFIDAAIEVADGANVTISGNSLSNVRGVATIGGVRYETGAILVNTIGAPGTVATIFGNKIFNNGNGIFVGVEPGDGDTSDVIVSHNNFTGNTLAIFSSDPAVDARFNWWGSQLGPKNAANPAGKGDAVGDLVDFDFFSTRVQAVLAAESLAAYEAQTTGFVVAGLGVEGSAPQIRVSTTNGDLIYTLNPFPERAGALLLYGVNVAMGDVNGDGFADVVAGIGLGGGGLLRVYDGASQARIRSYSLGVGISGGVNVAIGDINGDGIGDVIAGAASGTPLVWVFDGRSGGLLRYFNAFPGSTNKGGVTVAAGDVNGDGFDDIILGSGVGAAPQVRVVNGRNTAQQLLSAVPFDAAVTVGLNVAAGDFNGDGRADIVTSTSAGVSRTVRVLNGTNGAQLFEIDAYPGFLGGINVATADLNGDLIPEIVTAPGAGSDPLVKIFDGDTHLELTSFLAFPVVFQNGISVGVA